MWMSCDDLSFPGDPVAFLQAELAAADARLLVETVCSFRDNFPVTVWPTESL